MAIKQGIRIWRYKPTGGGVWHYHSRSAQRQDKDIPHAGVTLPGPAKTPGLGDFLFEVIGADNANLATQTDIKTANIFAHVRHRYVPESADIWYYSANAPQDDALSRIYLRRGTPGQRDRRRAEQLAQVSAALPGELNQDVVVIPQADEKVMYFSKDGKSHEELLEVEEGEVKLPAPGTQEFEEGLFIATLVTSLNKNRRKLEKAFKSAPDDPESAAEVIVEVVSGAAPAPTQGHNVLHSLPAVIDDISKCHQVVSEGLDSDDVSGATGGFGTGVGLVDSSWVAAGAILAYMKEICNAVDVHTVASGERVDTYGHNARLRSWVSVSSSYSKAFGMTVKAADAFNQVATGASSLAPLAGAAAAGGGLAACVTMTRSFWQCGKASRREKALRRAAKVKSGEGVVMKNDTQRLLAYAINKSKRKKRVKGIEGGIALASAGSSAVLLAVAAGAAAANAWNPVGWGIGIAVFIAGAGMLIYKIYRKRKSKDIARKDFPRLLVSRFLHLSKHHRPGGIRSVKTKARRIYELEVLEGMLLAYGIQPWRCLVVQEIPLVEKRIARHLKA